MGLGPGGTEKTLVEALNAVNTDNVELFLYLRKNRTAKYGYRAFRYSSSERILYHYMQPSSVKNGADIIGDGYGIVRGKWLVSNKELFEENNIKVNFENLGWYKPENSNINLKCEKRYRLRLSNKIANKVRKIRRRIINKKKEKMKKLSME